MPNIADSLGNKLTKLHVNLSLFLLQDQIPGFHETHEAETIS